MMNMSTSNNKRKSVLTSTGAGHGSSIRGSMSVNKSKKGGAPVMMDSQSRMRKTIYGGASRTIMSSSSRKNVQLAGSDKLGPVARGQIQVIDEHGQDVTPLPLLPLDSNAVRKNQSNMLADSSGGTPTDMMSQASIYQTGTVTASTFGGGPFTRSVFSASQSGRSTGSLADLIGEPTADHIVPNWSEIRHRREDVLEKVSEEDKEKNVEIFLTETETIWLLDLPGICVSMESDEAPEVQQQNTRYTEKRQRFQNRQEHAAFLVKSRVGNDRYAERGMNTFNQALKFKAVQTNRISHNDVGVMATNWDMHDTYELVAEMEAKAKEIEDENDEGTVSRPVSVANLDEKKDVEKGDELPPSTVTSTTLLREDTQFSDKKTVFDSQATMSSGFGADSVFGGKESRVTTVQEQDVDTSQLILKSEELRKTLVIMERVVNLNTYQPKQASYRGFPIVKDIDQVVKEVDGKKPPQKKVVVDLGPNLDRLWAYQCPSTNDRNVSCITWNKINPDLLAVGYGQFEFNKQKEGIICCWSLKNPEYPERVYTCSSGVMSIDFSLAHPNLLAVGLYDGTVAIYNVRSINNETILDSFESSGKHTGPVWQLKWIEKERGSGEERTEVLVSISTDGRVTQWSIRKGFESYDLMKLKRIPAKGGGKTKKAEAFISRFAGGFCFDFCPKDTNIYLAGTEEGFIHKCSCSYNEQYLDSYIGHTGPVYAIQWSPFLPDVFLTCSGDWSIMLWHQERLKHILSFHSSTKAVHSICWSPRCSTVFACVNEGAVEVWDLGQSTLDPIIINTPMEGTKLSFVTFAKNSDCLLVGDSEGKVAVYQLRCMPAVQDNQSDILEKIMNSSLASQLQK